MKFKLRSFITALLAVLVISLPALGADQRIQYNEQMVGAGHPTKSDTLNRLALVGHNTDGSHKAWVDAKEYGVLCDGTTDDAVALQAAIDYANTNNLPLYIPAGTCLSSAKLSIIRPFNDTKGFQMYGAGRGVSIIKYTGAASIGTLLELDGTSSGYTLNNHLHGFKLDLTDAPTGTVGLKINAGVWRSRFENLYVTRDVPGGGRTGIGIYMGSGTVSDVGVFDNKFSGLYVNNFSKNLHFQGTDLSGNTVTNCPIDHSYIANGDYNLYAEYFNGLSSNNTQYENAQTTGIYFANGESYQQFGGSIESPAAAAKGIDMDANTKSVVVFCDFYNNAGGHFNHNGKIGHFWKSTNSGIVVPSGGELRIDRDASYAGYIRFFKNGAADVRLKVSSSGNVLSVEDNADNSYFSFDMTNKILDAKNGAFFRIQNGSGNAGIYSYHGTPEGNVTAGPGSIVLDTTGGVASFYIKPSGSGNTGWKPLLAPAVSADKGDAAATLTVGSSETTSVWNTAISADRAVTLSTSNAYNGAKFRIVRTANATGAFNLNVGTGPLKAMGTAGSFCEVEYDGSAWVLTAYGTL